YAALVCLAVPLGGKLIYGFSVWSFSYTIDALAIALCYGLAAYILRTRLRIDFTLNHRRDVMQYVFVTAAAAIFAAIAGTACLVADGSIAWTQFTPSACSWFLGDAIGLLGI